MTVAEKLTRAIAAQQTEVDRLVDVAKTQLPAANARLTELTKMLGRLTPNIEEIVTVCHAAGIRLDE